MFVNYNDYELLYLIKDGEEKALKVMLKKYDELIYKVVRESYPYGDKSFDLIQEGRMVLYRCIYRYTRSKNASFYSYFLISLRRRLNKELDTDYYKNILCFHDNKKYMGSSLSRDYLLKRLFHDHFSDDELAMLIYEECIIRNGSLFNLSLKYNISYTNVSRKWNDIGIMLKKYIDYL